MTRIRTLAVVPGLAFLIACGGGSAPAKQTTAIVPAGVIKAALAKTVSTKSARFSMSMTIQAPDGGGRITGSGLMSLEKPLGRFFMDFSEIADSPFQGRAEARLVDGVMYMKFPGLEAETGGKQWLKLDLAALMKGEGLDLAQLQAQDPTQTLAYLESVSGDVRRLGADRVRGVETTRYSASIDLQKALDSITKGEGSAAEELLEEAGLKTLPTEVWIDGEGLLRKMALVMDLSKIPDAGGAGTATIEMEVYDYGVPVKVSVPPSSQVIDFAQMLGELE